MTVSNHFFGLSLTLYFCGPVAKGKNKRMKRTNATPLCRYYKNYEVEGVAFPLMTSHW